ncbi:hypothetical protein V2J09_021187 [Rumex salicifolius]
MKSVTSQPGDAYHIFDKMTMTLLQVFELSKKLGEERLRKLKRGEHGIGDTIELRAFSIVSRIRQIRDVETTEWRQLDRLHSSEREASINFGMWKRRNGNGLIVFMAVKGKKKAWKDDIY